MWTLSLLSVCENLVYHMFSSTFVWVCACSHSYKYRRICDLWLCEQMGVRLIAQKSWYRLWSRSLSLSCLSVWVWQLQCSISCYWKQLFDTVWPSLSSFWFDPHSWTVLWTCLCVSSSRWSLGRRDGGYRDLYPAGLALRSGWSRTASPDPPYRRRRTGASCEYNHIIIQKANPHKYI